MPKMDVWVALVALMFCANVAGKPVLSHAYPKLYPQVSHQPLLDAAISDRSWVAPEVRQSGAVRRIMAMNLTDGKQRELDHIVSDPQLYHGLRAMAGEIACAYYRFAHRLARQERCDSAASIIAYDTETTPFYDANSQFYRQGLRVEYPQFARRGYSYLFIVPPGSEYEDTDPRYPLHTLGYLFDRERSRALVITATLKVYEANDGRPGPELGLTTQPILLYLTIPAQATISHSPSPKAAYELAYRQAQLLAY
ncbi:hypothetical protein [Ferrimonas pelagia]|uniref:Uncharacterized protein n=1 Tax=Ferrimonas pelagia TaxID=1177826 RepID=A0ABP9EJK5_9GAMM